jgi:hypothetical protein
MKHSTFTGVVKWSGGKQLLVQGQSIVDEHPLVLERPDLFRDGDSGADIGGGPQTIERATAAPGEVRQTPSAGPRGGTTRVPKDGTVL